MIKDKIQYATNNLTQRKLRTGLTALSIAIAVATVLTLVSLSLGLYAGIDDLFEGLGGNTIFIQPRGFGGIDVGSGQLERRDARTIAQLAQIERAHGVPYDVFEVKYRNERILGFGAGMPMDENREFVRDAFLLEMNEGEYLRSGDRNRVTLGYAYKKQNGAFSRPVQLRDRIEVNGVRYEVIGFHNELGNPTDDLNIYFTEDVFRSITGNEEGVSAIIARPTPDANIERVVENIERQLRRNLGQRPGEETFFVQTAEDLRQSFNSILAVLIAFIIAIGGVSLVVGSINIMNTMYTAVLERTQEIGTIKAIGGKNSDVISFFLIESAIIGALGGIMGVGVAYLAAYSITNIAAQAGFSVLQFYFPIWLIVAGVCFAMITGIVSGVFPARQASKQKPVDALRYE